MPVLTRATRRAGAGIVACGGRPPRRVLWAGRGWHSCVPRRWLGILGEGSRGYGRGRRLNLVGVGLLASCFSTAPDSAPSHPWVLWSSPRIGLASWYSEQDPGVTPLTANGELFTDAAFTAAMWDVPFDSCVQVTNLLTLARVVVRINDRGPHRQLFRRGRLIDLSRSAFAHVADLHDGLMPVQLDLLEAPVCPAVDPTTSL